MGCFSFICQKSGEPVLSSSFSGDAVHLFLLKDGKVIEHMFGNYDSYGRVFSDQPTTNPHLDNDSFEWKMEWGEVVNLMFHKSINNGIAAILTPYWKEGDPYPTERSDDDPNQGWGEHGKLLGSISKEIDTKIEKPFHKTYYE